MEKVTKTITVCWQCRRSDLQLFNLKDIDGKKTKDYICRACIEIYGMKRPPIANSSYERIEVKNDKNKKS